MSLSELSEGFAVAGMIRVILSFVWSISGAAKRIRALEEEIIDRINDVTNVEAILEKSDIVVLRANIAKAAALMRSDLEPILIELEVRVNASLAEGERRASGVPLLSADDTFEAMAKVRPEVMGWVSVLDEMSSSDKASSVEFGKADFDAVNQRTV